MQANSSKYVNDRLFTFIAQKQTTIIPQIRTKKKARRFYEKQHLALGKERIGKLPAATTLAGFTLAATLAIFTNTGTFASGANRIHRSHTRAVTIATLARSVAVVSCRRGTARRAGTRAAASVAGGT